MNRATDAGSATAANANVLVVAAVMIVYCLNLSSWVVVFVVVSRSYEHKLWSNRSD